MPWGAGGSALGAAEINLASQRPFNGQNETETVLLGSLLIFLKKAPGTGL